MKKKNVPRFEPINSHLSIEISMAQKRYSAPKLFIPRVNGKPTVAPGKRWYAYFYWRTSPNGPLDRKFSYTKKMNRLPSAKERRAAGNHLVSILHTALERGWIPDAEERKAKKVVKRGDSMILADALEYAYKIKEKGGKSITTLKGYQFHKDRFLEWAKSNGYYGLKPDRFSVDHFYEFLDWLRFEYVNEKTGLEMSGSSINNHKASLSALFTTMKNERLISVNFIKDIPDIDSEPINNKAFTHEELALLKAEMQRTDPYLIPLFSFILYPLLRPREICRLKVNSLNTDNWLIKVQTKTEILSVRRIIDKLKPTIEGMKLEEYPGEFYLFTNRNQPADWDASLQSRYDHFSKRFKIIKDNLGFGREYGLYSGRHTAIMDLYDSLLGQGFGEMKALLELMPHTTHKSVAGIKAYIRRHRKTIPADHSDLFTIDF